MLIEAKCCKTKSDQFENQNFTQNLAQKTETQKTETQKTVGEVHF